MLDWTRLAAAALLAMVLLAATDPAGASANERRDVARKYQFVVGFLEEPALSHEPNGLDLVITVPTEGDRPVVGLEGSLRATVAIGDGSRTMPLLLEPRHDRPGAYVAPFVPTRAGRYVFIIAGTIEGVPINEKFPRGPGRFAQVIPAQTEQFPERIPDATATATAVRAAQTEVALTRNLALAGVALGLVGLALASGSLLRRTGSEAAGVRQDPAQDPSISAARPNR